MVNNLENQQKSKPFLIVVVTVILTVFLLALGALGFWLVQSKFLPSKFPSPSPAVKTMNDSPLPNFVSSPSPAILVSYIPSAQPSPSMQATSDLEQITAALAAKHSKPVADAQVTINENDGTYASGLIKFTGEISGGWFLAYNSGTEWIVVADGNGTVMCDDIDPYNFPVSMVPECWDEASSTLITR